MMKKLGIIVAIAFFIQSLYSQKTTNDKDFSFLLQQKEQYYIDKPKGKGTGYKQLKRWEDFVQNRLDKNRNIVNNSAMTFTAYENLKKRGLNNNMRTNGFWEELGPDSWANNPDPYPGTSQGGWIPGNGRINEIAFHPTNANIFYAGAAGGGLWKTTDGGSSWVTLTSGMPNIAVSGIAISHSNPNTIYILTGDGDSKDLVSIGVLKTTDGGYSWHKTGLEFERDEIVFGTELKINPTNANIIIATTSNGIYYTDDGGDNWPLVENGNFYDVEFNPSNTDTVYCSTDNMVYRSVNSGNNWSLVRDFSAFVNANTDSRLELAVTQDNTDKVYALLGDRVQYLGVFISDDRGTTWVRHYDDMDPNILSSSETGAGATTQAIYDLAIEVSPTNEDNIFVGGINIWESTDGGDNWVISTFWRQDWNVYQYVHSDIHELIFNGSVLYSGNDGGISQSLNHGTTWTDISDGLAIMQPHKIGIVNSNTNLVYIGAQDNGVNRYSGTTTVDHVRGADGFECIIMPTNTDNIYSSRQYGIIERSDDGGNTFSSIIVNTNNKRFNNPLILKPDTRDRLVVSRASEIIIHFLNGSIDDNKLIPQNELHHTSHIDISVTNSDLLIAASVGRSNINTSDSLWMTTDLFDPSSNTWTNISGNLPLERRIISDVVVDPINSNHFIVSFSGYVDGNKVFETWDRGSTWHNNSYNLENVPVNCIAVDSEIANSVYIGTDLGVFYKEPGSEEWTYYSNGLPPVMVHELEINTNNNIIYAATYGRGLWKSPLFSNCPANYTLTQANSPGDPNYTGIQVYEASNSISSTRIVTGGIGTDVRYQAGSFIDLKPGFLVGEGNMFESVIGECGAAKAQ